MESEKVVSRHGRHWIPFRHEAHNPSAVSYDPTMDPTKYILETKDVQTLELHLRKNPEEFLYLCKENLHLLMQFPDPIAAFTVVFAAPSAQSNKIVSLMNGLLHTEPKDFPFLEVFVHLRDRLLLRQSHVRQMYVCDRPGFYTRDLILNEKAVFALLDTGLVDSPHGWCNVISRMAHVGLYDCAEQILPAESREGEIVLSMHSYEAEDGERAAAWIRRCLTKNPNVEFQICRDSLRAIAGAPGGLSALLDVNPEAIQCLLDILVDIGCTEAFQHPWVRENMGIEHLTLAFRNNAPWEMMEAIAEVLGDSDETTDLHLRQKFLCPYHEPIRNLGVHDVLDVLHAIHELGSMSVEFAEFMLLHFNVRPSPGDCFYNRPEVQVWAAKRGIA